MAATPQVSIGGAVRSASNFRYSKPGNIPFAFGIPPRRITLFSTRRMVAPPVGLRNGSMTAGSEMFLTKNLTHGQERAHSIGQPKLRSKILRHCKAP